MNRRRATIFIVLTLVAVIIFSIAAMQIPGINTAPPNEKFDGQTAYAHVETQIGFGPRVAGSEAHTRAIAYFSNELQANGWDVSLQEGLYQGQQVQNVIAKRGNGRPWTIIGAHYDSRLVADHDPELKARSTPVPGANDGASGAAVLLELGSSLSKDLSGQVWLVFFDAEDNGNLPGWDWILGSRFFVQELNGKPDSAVIVDMIGDKDLNIFYEGNSDPEISQEIWAEAALAGYGDQFIQSSRHSMLDDHTPFLEAGIPAVDIIDFDYPYYHTISDTADKVSPASLAAVGVTLQNWLEKRHSKD